MREATVTITPAETVTIAKRDLELLAKAARLFQQIFDSLMTDYEAIHTACEIGLTEDHDCDASDSEVDTEVDLKPEFLRALGEAEKICGLLEEGGL